jgi:dinuclear metal center YbgI/SA1388 family protein
MKIADLDRYFRSLLPIDEFIRIDSSRNGLQVARRDPEVRRVACAVDAALEVFAAAIEREADMLFVHHGLFWGREQLLTGAHFERVRTLLDNDLALYAVHLPLDADLSLGNNAGMAAALELRDVEPFGLVKGVPIGVEGRFTEPRSIDTVVESLFGERYRPLAVLPFGKRQISSVGLISGGAPLEVDQAIEEGLDLYITGDANHIAYHRCREAGINVIFGGHYATEVWGVQSVAERLVRDTEVDGFFLDVPTGL